MLLCALFNVIHNILYRALPKIIQCVYEVISLGHYPTVIKIQTSTTVVYKKDSQLFGSGDGIKIKESPRLLSCECEFEQMSVVQKQIGNR